MLAVNADMSLPQSIAARVDGQPGSGQAYGQDRAGTVSKVWWCTGTLLLSWRYQGRYNCNSWCPELYKACDHSRHADALLRLHIVL